jgi:CRP-like cAMP-binding protein
MLLLDALRPMLEMQGEVQSLPEWQLFVANARIDEVAAGVTLVRQGEVDSHVRFVLQGLVKLGYEMANGTQKTKSIVQAGAAFASIHALEGGISTYAATTLEPSVIARIPYGQLQALMQKHHAWERIVRKVFANLAVKKEQREYELLTLSPTQRWENFKQHNGSLIGRITQIEIAALIGITPVALSRLKGRAERGRTALSHAQQVPIQMDGPLSFVSSSNSR